jgi:hypothetical protein
MQMHILQAQRLEHRRRWRRRAVTLRRDRRTIAEIAASIHDFDKRLNLLSASDRALVLMTLEQGLTRKQMGELVGVAKGTISRRLRRIMNRLHDPLIVAVTDPACTLTAEYKVLAVEYFLHCLPMPAIAQRHRLTLYDVRIGLEYIRGWFRGNSTHLR